MSIYKQSYSPADEAIKTAFGCLAVAVVASSVICIPIIIHANNQTNSSQERLNAKVERDLNTYSFNTQGVIFDKTNENYFIKVTGSSNKSSYLAAKYKVSEQDFYSIKPTESDFVNTKDLGLNYKFLDTLLDILYHSQFLGKENENLALINNGELVLNISKPHVNKGTNSVSYNLTVAKVNNNNLKLATLVVSAPLDEKLKENPNLIYSYASEKVDIETITIKTYKDVFQVEMYDNSTLIL